MFSKLYREIMDHILLRDKKREEILKAISTAKIEWSSVSAADTSE